ncbi:hypothetical protein MMC29_004294 [Sticta canariensis]|nr:hypothetical protein [Sticta canariensis]
MPKGQPLITWSAENDLKLFLTVLAVQKIQVDCAAVAKAFGSNVPGSCIQNRMAILRRKANEVGGAGSSSGTAKRSRAPAVNTPVKKRKLSKAPSEVQNESDEEPDVITPSSSDADDEVTEGFGKPMTPPMSAKTTKTNEGVSTKSRVSPRSSAKNDYKTLSDPFIALGNALDTNGEQIFQTDKSDTEDSAASDGEFRTESNRIEPEVTI